MQKIRFSLATIGLLMITLGAACGTRAQPAAAQPVAAQPSGAQAPAAAPAGNSAVPLCTSPTTCQAPTALMYKLDCVNKVPYTNVAVPPGTTFEVLDKSGDFTCAESGFTFEGKPVISCYGTQLMSFDLKLTNSACGGAALETGTGQCQQGYGYDSAQKCCAPVAADSGGSTTVRVDLGACPLPLVPRP